MKSPSARPELRREPIRSFSLPNDTFLGLLREALSRGVAVRFRARGFSMDPFIRDGDVITIAPPPAVWQPGDVAAFPATDTGRLTVHRLLVRQHNAFLAKGDNAPTPDGMVGMESLLGRVVRVERTHGMSQRLGLGPERRLIAFLSRHGWLRPLLVVWRWVHFWPRRFSSGQ